LDSTFNSIKAEGHKSAAAAFAGYYEKSGIYLEIGGEDGVLFGNLPHPAVSQPGALAWVRYGNDTYIRISDQLTSGYYFLYMKSQNDVMSACLRQGLLSVLSGTGVVLALCILLYFTLKKINQPVDRLAHELRTPLTVISGYAEALMISRMSEEQRYNATRYILDESRRLSEVAEKLLTISSLRERGANRESVDIEALFAHAQRTYGQVTCAVGWKRVTGDKVLLQSLINNLVANAIKASPQDGVVELISRDRQIIVRDRGKGMSDEQLEYVNHPGRTESPQQRSGLGVPLCHEIARLHKATLHFTSEAGKGTQAAVTFTTR
jgi:light-regulated signal transduction histidine kinase (bacteriophytochrome)